MRRALGADHRGPRARPRAASLAGGVRRLRRVAMRLLHAGRDHDREGTPRPQPESVEAGNQGGYGRTPLPLHRLQPDRRVDRGRRGAASQGGGVKKTLDVVGKFRRRVDGRAKVTGALRYADDLAMPRMLHAKLLRSPHPHAVIEKISTEKA